MDPVNQHSAGLLVYKNIYTLHCVWLPSQRCLSGMMQRMRWSLTMCWLWFLGSTSTTTSRTAVEILLKKVAIWSVGVLGGSSSSVFKGGDYWSSLSPTRENRWVDSIRRKAICRQCCSQHTLSIESLVPCGSSSLAAVDWGGKSQGPPTPLYW